MVIKITFFELQGNRKVNKDSRTGGHRTRRWSGAALIVGGVEGESVLVASGLLGPRVVATCRDLNLGRTENVGKSDYVTGIDKTFEYELNRKQSEFACNGLI
jgi:hypothetical protein